MKTYFLIKIQKPEDAVREIVKGIRDHFQKDLSKAILFVKTVSFDVKMVGDGFDVMMNVEPIDGYMYAEGLRYARGVAYGIETGYEIWKKS